MTGGPQKGVRRLPKIASKSAPKMKSKKPDGTHDDADMEEAEEDDENATMRLVHCTVFPRNAVAEQKICRSVFRRAVEEILPLCSNRTEEDEEEEKNEVVN